MITMFALWTTSTSEQQLEVFRAKNQEIDIQMHRAKVASEAKTTFLANMSHEIRTPMNGMIGMTRHLYDKTTNEQDKEDLRTVLDSQESMLALLNDILDFSKIEAGKLAIELKDFDLLASIRNVVQMFGPKASSHGLSLSLSGHLDTSHMLGDDKRIRQVLCNLIGNAIKFSQGGEVSVDVSAQSKVRSNPHMPDLIVIRVKDQGIGISQDKIDKLFRQFEQVHDTTTVDVGGTGLGLAITKELVDAMGGTLRVESTVGVGSTFSFELPTKFSKIGQQDIDLGHQQRALELRRIQEKAPKVLVVDDKAINRKVASLALKKLGCRVQEAQDGQEAVTICQSQPFDLIFMDLRMPVLNGLDATTKIREDGQSPNQDTPIVALTANAYEEDRRRCKEVGMQAHLAKPFKNEDLQRAIQGYVFGSNPDPTISNPAA